MVSETTPRTTNINFIKEFNKTIICIFIFFLCLFTFLGIFISTKNIQKFDDNPGIYNVILIICLILIIIFFFTNIFHRSISYDKTEVDTSCYKDKVKELVISIKIFVGILSVLCSNLIIYFSCYNFNGLYNNSGTKYSNYKIRGILIFILIIIIISLVSILYDEIDDKHCQYNNN